MCMSTNSEVSKAALKKLVVSLFCFSSSVLCFLASAGGVV